MIWDKFAYQWEKNYASAEKYFKAHGDLIVPANYVDEDGISLGAWIRYLRTYQDKGYFSDEQKARLDAIGMNWGSDYDLMWEQKYKEAELYYLRNGDLNIPSTYVTERGIRLGTWIFNQRWARKNPDTANNKLTEDRIQKLNAIGMIWEAEDSWNKRYELAKQFYCENGHLRIPQSYRAEGNIWIGKWVYQQRIAGRGGKLSDEQTRKLTDIGMNWNTAEEEVWEDNFSAAKDFFNENGHLNVPYGYRGGNGKNLYLWVKSQRKYRLLSDKRLSNERIQRLDSIGMNWFMKSEYLKDA